MASNQDSAVIKALLARVEAKDARLAADLRAELDLAAGDREYGLVFNRHLPEVIELRGRTPRRGDLVRIHGEGEDLWRVLRLSKVDDIAIADLVSLTRTLDDGETPERTTAALADLSVYADFRDVIYPGLRPTGRIERGGGKPFHTVINGENLHALEALTFTHEASVDCIYIDPPYNTGGGNFVYNDKRIAREDPNRHSAWLSFMERRLLLAKRLLKPTGVLIAAIDDNELYSLKLLLDKVFGEQQFIGNVVWQGVGKNDARYLAGGVDYMLIYARSEAALSAANTRWKERKPDVDLALNAAAKAWEESGHDAEKATGLYRKALNTLKDQLSPGTRMYDKIDESGRVYKRDNLSSPSPSKSLRYELMHPETGKPVYMHANGWRLSKDNMPIAVAEGRVLFGKDHTTSAYYKRYLDEMTARTAPVVFEQPRRSATQALQTLFGDKRFQYPKDTNVLARWIGLVTSNNPDAVILDFFGGSGSTAHAVMEMNAADGGRRQCLLVTNNEVSPEAEKALLKTVHRKGDEAWEAQGIYRYVTRPRIEIAATGVRPDGSKYNDGFDENVAFFDLTYADGARMKSGMAFDELAAMLWLRAGGQGSCSTDVGDDGFVVEDSYAVLFDADRWRQLIDAISPDKHRYVFLVPDDSSVMEAVSDALEDTGVKVVRVGGSSYLSHFEHLSGFNR